VVNEGLNEDGTYRNDTFFQVLGPEYIRIAFAAAAAADPHAKLYYNDYNIEYVGPKSDGARENIVKYLQDAGIRIDGVGLQGHFVVGSTPSIGMFADFSLFYFTPFHDIVHASPSTQKVNGKDWA